MIVYEELTNHSQTLSLLSLSLSLTFLHHLFLFYFIYFYLLQKERTNPPNSKPDQNPFDSSSRVSLLLSQYSAETLEQTKKNKVT